MSEHTKNIENLNLKIKEQEEKLKKLKAQKEQAERRARAIEKKRERAKDTRRKILLGAFFLEQMKNGKLQTDWVKAKLDPFLKRNADRELFGLPPIVGVEEPKEEKTAQKSDF